KRAGTRLYTHFQLDHERLFAVAETLAGGFLMTYDNDLHVQAMAERHGFDTEPVSMIGTHLSERKELLIGRGLEWLRRPGSGRVSHYSQAAALALPGALHHLDIPIVAAL